MIKIKPLDNSIKIDILGSKWKIIWKDESEDESLKDIGGIADPSTKTIVINTTNYGNMNCFEVELRRCLRHEIIHAFMFESGIGFNYIKHDEYGHDENMIDWLAIQFPKLQKAFCELECNN